MKYPAGSLRGAAALTQQPRQAGAEAGGIAISLDPADFATLIDQNEGRRLPGAAGKGQPIGPGAVHADIQQRGGAAFGRGRIGGADLALPAGEIAASRVMGDQQLQRAGKGRAAGAKEKTDRKAGKITAHRQSISRARGQASAGGGCGG